MNCLSPATQPTTKTITERVAALEADMKALQDLIGERFRAREGRTVSDRIYEISKELDALKAKPQPQRRDNRWMHGREAKDFMNLHGPAVEEPMPLGPFSWENNAYTKTLPVPPLPQHPRFSNMYRGKTAVKAPAFCLDGALDWHFIEDLKDEELEDCCAIARLYWWDEAYKRIQENTSDTEEWRNAQAWREYAKRGK